MKENDARWKLGPTKRMKGSGYGKYVRKYKRLFSHVYISLKNNYSKDNILCSL